MTRAGPLAVKIMLLVGEERAMGPGRADVLAAIESQGSIRAAGISLGMSYRFTWNLVDSMNRCFREPLVAATPGGAKGGRAGLTPAGRRVLEAYRTLERQMMGAADGAALEVLAAMLRETLDEAAPSPGAKMAVPL